MYSRVFQAFRRTTFQSRTSQKLLRGDHGHQGPEYGFSYKTQKNISFATKLTAFAICCYLPFYVVDYHKAKKQQASQ